MVDGQLDWKGMKCLAGFSNMQIQYNGDGKKYYQCKNCECANFRVRM
jgi:hypothetical protein